MRNALKYSGMAVGAGIPALTVLLFVWLNVHSSAGNWFTGSFGMQLLLYGRLAGLLMALLFLFQLLSMGKGRLLAQVFPPAVLEPWHRRIGFAILAFLVLHVGLLMWGRAVSYEGSFGGELWNFIADKRWGSLASAGIVLFLAVLTFTLLWRTKKLAFQSWKKTHYLVYAVILFVFFHQIFYGLDFVSSRGFRIFWIAVFALCVLDAGIYNLRKLRKN